MIGPNDTAPPRQSNGRGRVPPHNLQAEEALLGALLINPAMLPVVADLSPADFYRPANGIIFEAIQEAAEGDGKPDAVTVADILRRNGQLKNIGGPGVLLGVQNACPATTNAPRYVRIIREQANLRRAIADVGEIAELAYDGAMSAADVATAMLERAQALVDSTNHELKIFSMAQLVEEHYDALEAREEGKGLGLSTGYTDLDELLGGGLREGELWSVIAEPGVGKSAFVGNIARRVAALGHRVLVVSVEMARLELVDRMLAAEARLSLSALRGGEMSARTWERIHAGHSALEAAAGLSIIDDPDVTLDQIDVAVRRTGANLFIVDYAQILRAPEGTTTREREVAAISSGLKRMARRHRIPCVVLSAINRNVAGRADQRPVRSDIRESGQLEYDSNGILGLYRDELKNPDTESPGIMEVIVLKSRNSGAGTVRLRYDPDTQLISTLYQPGRP